MNETISEPRGSISDYAPKIIYMKVNEDKIGAIIGPGGKTIKGITEATGAQVSVEDDGTVTIYCREKEKAEEAQRMIGALIEEPEVGKVYTGTVKRIMDFGAFIEFLPGKEGLCHISKLSRSHIESVTDVLEEGQTVPVKLVEIDRLGRINLSYIDAIDPDGAPSRPPRRPSHGRPPRDNRRDSRNPKNEDRRR
jgi:polyribonucleotide nucleotidyltransferase